MGFLETITKKENFSSSIESLKENTQNGIENTIAHFTKFVEQTDSSLENAIEEMCSYIKCTTIIWYFWKYVRISTKVGIHP